MASATLLATTLSRRSASALPPSIHRRGISVGAKIPSVKVKEVVGDAVNEVATDDFFKCKKIVLVGMPAAFSPTCSEKHLPGYLSNLPALKQKGVDKVAVLAVNDFFTMKEWGKSQKLGDTISLLADGNGELTKALDLELDLRKAGLGVRSKRFSAVVDNGVVTALNVEPDGTGYTSSAAECTLKQV